MTDYCAGCGRSDRIRRLKVVNPDGEVTVCDDCEDELRAEVVQEVEV